jgi:hypothetical protein
MFEPGPRHHHIDLSGHGADRPSARFSLTVFPPRTCTSVQLIVRGGAALPMLIYERQDPRLKVIRRTWLGGRIHEFENS